MENQEVKAEQQVERLKACRREYKKGFALVRYSNFDQGLVCIGTRVGWENCGISNELWDNNLNPAYYQAFMLLHHLSLQAKSKKGAMFSDCQLSHIPDLFENYEKFIDLFSERVEHKLEVTVHEDEYQKVLDLLPDTLKTCAKYLIKKNHEDFDLQMEEDYWPSFGLYASWDEIENELNKDQATN
jgi:hypothetical protein